MKMIRHFSEFIDGFFVRVDVSEIVGVAENENGGIQILENLMFLHNATNRP